MRFAVWTLVGLLSVHLVQIVVLWFLGIEARDAIFLLEREHWARMWTPFTSAIAHSTNGHLAVNLVNLLLFGPPLAATVGASRAIGISYAGAVLGQLVGIWSGKGDLMGASAGVMTAASASVVLAPIWVWHARNWAHRAWSEVHTLLEAGRFGQALAGAMAFSLVVFYPGILVYVAGIQLKSDLSGASIFATYPWGGAPSGPGYTAHLFGFAFGAAAGVVILANAAWRKWNDRIECH